MDEIKDWHDHIITVTKANYEITPAVIDMSGVVFEDKEVKYDGTIQNINFDNLLIYNVIVFVNFCLVKFSFFPNKFLSS